MEDTSPEISQMQQDFFMRKTPAERFMAGIEMMEEVRKMVAMSIRNNNPGITDSELKLAVIKRYYEHDYSAEEMKKIEDLFSRKG